MDICSKDLRCPQGRKQLKLNLTSTEIVQGHYYCYQNLSGFVNNGEYDIIDRGDEQNIKLASKHRKINHYNLEKCNDTHNGSPGVKCGTKCIPSQYWCNEGRPSVCPNGENQINTNDPQLCANHTFWRDVSCNVYRQGKVSSYGRRCNGSSQQCVYPWYLNRDGDVVTQSQCSDKSDQTFAIGGRCPNSSTFIAHHNSHFCNYTENNSSFICTDPLVWVADIQLKNPHLHMNYENPHKCWDSCSVPGPNCDSCTNKKYFECGTSGKCIHRDLLCDGHPQVSVLTEDRGYY